MFTFSLIISAKTVPITALLPEFYACLAFFLKSGVVGIYKKITRLVHITGGPLFRTRCPFHGYKPQHFKEGEKDVNFLIYSMCKNCANHQGITLLFLVNFTGKHKER